MRREVVTTRLDREQKDRLEWMAKMLSDSQSEIIRKALDVMYILYHPKLKFTEALRPLHEIGEEIGVETKYREVDMDDT